MILRISGPRQCDFFLRIDDVFLAEQEAVRGLCTLLHDRKIPFLAALKGDDLRVPDNFALIDLIRRSGGTIGLHGFSHAGRFGPFQSELLQMRIPDILMKIEEISEAGRWGTEEPRILVPPFNALGPGQIAALASGFSVICGGPETLRFTDRRIGPVALDGGGWYFPSLHPWYGSAAAILKSGALSQGKSFTGAVCITTHLGCEAVDAFGALSRLLECLPRGTRPWKGVF
jgi:hypothetical protein